MTDDDKRRLAELSTQGTFTRAQVDEYIALLDKEKEGVKKDESPLPIKNLPTSSKLAEPSEALPSAKVAVTQKSQEPQSDQIRSKYEGIRSKVNVPSKKPFTPGTKRQ